MSMTDIFEGTVEVGAPHQDVWALLTDPTLLCCCADGPAATVSSRRCEQLTITVQIGGMSIPLRGHVRLVDSDRPRGRVEMVLEAGSVLTQSAVVADISAAIACWQTSAYTARTNSSRSAKLS